MAKLPWKRDESSPEQATISAYLPAQPVDYTSMPVVEDEGQFAAFRRLPAPARIVIILIPLLLIVGGVWSLREFMTGAPKPAVAKPRPQVKLADARLVNPSEIAIEGEARNVPDGTSVTAQLIVDEEIAQWADPKASTGKVEGGKIKMRLHKSSAWADHLQATSVYSVEIGVASSPPITTAQGLVVPAPLADSFYGGVVAEAATPAPEPTKAPAPTATPEPGPPTVVVGANATMLVSPTLGSKVAGVPGKGASYQPLMRTPDNQFFLVQEGPQVGWLPASQVTIDAVQAARIKVTTPPRDAVAAGPLKATVGNGGNIRFRPDVKTGTVLGQMHAGQTVTLIERTQDGGWYHVVAPEAEGWVSVTLLQLDPRVAANVAVGSAR